MKKWLNVKNRSFWLNTIQIHAYTWQQIYFTIYIPTYKPMSPYLHFGDSPCSTPIPMSPRDTRIWSLKPFQTSRKLNHTRMTLNSIRRAGQTQYQPSFLHFLLFSLLACSSLFLQKNMKPTTSSLLYITEKVVSPTDRCPRYCVKPNPSSFLIFSAWTPPYNSGLGNERVMHWPLTCMWTLLPCVCHPSTELWWCETILELLKNILFTGSPWVLIFCIQQTEKRGETTKLYMHCLGSTLHSRSPWQYTWSCTCIAWAPLAFLRSVAVHMKPNPASFFTVWAPPYDPSLGRDSGRTCHVCSLPPQRTRIITAGLIRRHASLNFNIPHEQKCWLT